VEIASKTPKGVDAEGKPMSVSKVIPGLVLTGTMYEALEAGIATYAPSFGRLSFETFSDPARWTNVPNDRGLLSKSENILLNTPELTLRANVWHCEDSRAKDRPMPHNHPWSSFTGHVLLGGYVEDRYQLKQAELHQLQHPGGSVVADLGVQHISPAANTLEHWDFHEVKGVLAPGETLSLMVCVNGRRGDWTHLDVDASAFVPGQPVNGFSRMLAALNPHRPDLQRSVN
jgi:hypothetical protein